MAKREIRIVVKEPGKPAEVRMVENELEVLQKIVGGYVEMVVAPELGMADRVYAYVNEEGRLDGFPKHVIVTVNGKEKQTLRGTLLLSKCDEQGEEVGLSMAEAEKYRAALDQLPVG